MRLKKSLVLVLAMMLVSFTLSAAERQKTAVAAQSDFLEMRTEGLLQQKEFIGSYLLDCFMFIHASFGHMQWTINAIHFTGEPVSMPYLPQMKHFNQKTMQMVEIFKQESASKAEIEYADNLLANLKKLDQAIDLAEKDLKLKKRPINKESKPMKTALKLFEEAGKNIPELNELLGKTMPERLAE